MEPADQMEQELAACFSEGQLAAVVEDDEVNAREVRTAAIITASNFQSVV